MKDDVGTFNPNQDPPKVLDGADIIKVVRIVKEKPVEEKRNWSFTAWKNDVVHGSERIRGWLIGVKIKIP
jgi:hypothetical protein